MCTYKCTYTVHILYILVRAIAYTYRMTIIGVLIKGVVAVGIGAVKTPSLTLNPKTSVGYKGLFSLYPT